MKIVVARPPNFDAIAKVFNYTRVSALGVIFCYGDRIYNPHGVHIPPELIAHEMVHSERQEKFGPERWWDSYLANREFRYNEELPAHQAEYRAIQDVLTKGERKRYLAHIAHRLSGSLYNHMTTFEKAKRAIKQGVDLDA